MGGFINNKLKWENLLSRFPEANFLQSWAWGEFHQRLGHPVYRVSRESGVFQAIVEPAKRARYLTVPGGPLARLWTRSSLESIVSELRRIAVDEHCVFIRIRPQVLDTPEHRRVVADLGFRRAPMHLHAETTRVIDLRQSNEQLLSGMRKSTRYEIRRAQKLGINVEQSTDESLIDHFVTLQEETAKREHFVPFSKEYLLEQFRAFKLDDAVRFFFVRKRSDPTRSDLIRLRSDLLKPISMAFVIFYRKEAVYHYAASNAASRSFPAAHAIQWAIIHEAKKRGCTKYNLWGDVPDDQLGAHRFSGPALFKRGFGGQQIAYLSAHDLPLSPRYWMNWAIESVRKMSRNL